MTYVKIDEQKYPAEIFGKITDYEWDGRASKTIRIKMDPDTAKQLFANGAKWSIVTEETISEGAELKTHTQEFDNSDYCVAGAITDYRDGTLDVKMGRLTDMESLLKTVYGGD